jgi:dethiobiotin synthetase
MRQAYFITGTGTDIGKTFVAEGLARSLRERGEVVRAVKPVLSGYDASVAQASDAGRLLAACGGAADAAAVATIAPWRFAAPLSPDRAAALEERAIDFAQLVGWCRGEITANAGTLLIEGIGGVMVPLDARHTVRDWIAALDVPVLLIAGSYLGALSHTLSALAALREVGVTPVAIVVNESTAGTGIGVDETLVSLRPHVNAIPLAWIGCGTGDFRALTDIIMKGGQ